MKDYIYQQPKWPHFSWDINQLSDLLAEVRHQQGLLLGRMSSLGFELQAEASLEIFTTNIVKSSQVEGESLDQLQVRSSLAEHLGIQVAGLLPKDRYIDGVVEMMLDATQNNQQLLTAERLFGWHAALFPSGFSGMYPVEVGKWRSDKKGPMQIVSGAIGKEKVHYQAPPAQDLAKEMEQFLSWFNLQRELDLFLKAAIAHFWFVTIHPFDDGNGRIARAIADMCLAACDKTACRFYSMSAQIEQERKNYYAILERCQYGSLDITQWLEWFLQCLLRAIKHADKSIEHVLLKAAIWEQLKDKPVNARHKKVLTKILANSEGDLTTKKYAKLAKCSHDTALRDIQLLIDFGVLKKSQARGRNVHYQLSSSQR